MNTKIPKNQAPEPFDGEECVLIPRMLISAACSAIDKKREGVKVLAELRRYTTGDLSNAPVCVAKTGFLQETDQHLLHRFIETTEDGEGFDIGKNAIKRLANLGVVESVGFGRYGVTTFGYWVHEKYWHQNPSLPLKTNSDRDADARAAIAAAKENK